MTSKFKNNKKVLFFEFVTLLLLGFTVLKPLVISPLLADDLIISTYTSYILDQGWFFQIKTAIEQALGGTHFTVLNGIISGLWVKTWISASVALGLDLHLGFWLVKFLIYCLWIFVIFNFLKKEVFHNVKSVTIIASILLAMGFTIQIHTLWSSDPVTNFPFAGYLPVVFAIIAISYFTENFKNYSKKVLLTSSLLNITALLFYEINFSIIFFQFTLILIQFNKDKLSFKKLYIKLIPPVSTICLAFILRFFAAQNSAQYEGTTISISWNFVKTLFIEIFSSMPFASTPLFFEFSRRLNFGVGLGFFVIFIAVGLGLFKSIKIQKESSIKNEVLLPLVAWALSAAAIQALTTKVQSEVNQVGKVYTFYATTSTVIVIIVSILILYFVNKKNLKDAFIFVFIFAFSLQVSMNYSLNNQVNKTFEPNVRLVRLATIASDNQTRCQRLNDWYAMGWPSYYSAGVTDGLNRLSRRINGELFCIEDRS